MSDDVAVAEKLDPEEFFKSLNGFEEIAIEAMFRKSAAQLALDAQQGNTFPLMRALLFIEAKRAGKSQNEAFKHVMSARVDEVADRFVDSTEETEGKGDSVNEMGPTPIS